MRFERSFYDGSWKHVTQRLEIADFTGFDPRVRDTFDGTLTFLSGEGLIVVLRAKFEETKEASHRLVGTFPMCIGPAGQPIGGPLQLGNVTNNEGSGAGDWQPFLVRVQGPRHALEGQSVSLSGQTWTLKEQEGQFYFSGSPAELFVAARDVYNPQPNLLHGRTAILAQVRDANKKLLKVSVVPGLLIRPEQGTVENQIKLTVTDGNFTFERFDGVTIEVDSTQVTNPRVVGNTVTGSLRLTADTPVGYKQVTLKTTKNVSAGQQETESKLPGLLLVVAKEHLLLRPLGSHREPRHPPGSFVDWAPPFRYDFQGVKKGTPGDERATYMTFWANYLPKAARYKWEVKKGTSDFGQFKDGVDTGWFVKYLPGDSEGEATLNLSVVDKQDNVLTRLPTPVKLYIYNSTMTTWRETPTTSLPQTSR